LPPTIDSPCRPGMDRRRFLLTSLAGATAAPLAGRAQQSRRLPRVAFVGPASEQDAGAGAMFAVFKQTLHGAGHSDGKTKELDTRFLAGRLDRLPDTIANILALRPDVIVVVGTFAARTAKAATSTVPIVFMGVGDPVDAGLVSSLARPGGNITGISWAASPDDHAKMLQLLRDVAPTITRVANISGKGDAIPLEVNPQMGIQIQSHAVDGRRDLDRELNAIRAKQPHALLVSGSPPTYVFRKMIADFALENRLPSVHQFPEAAIDGALLSYGPSMREWMQRGALYVDKLLRGAKPAELPVEQPTRYDVLINLKTAKALGLTIPPSLLARADQVIE
jgi:putative tryptophan/tyrosine transport system substrate-binding protein